MKTLPLCSKLKKMPESIEIFTKNLHKLIKTQKFEKFGRRKMIVSFEQ